MKPIIYKKGDAESHKQCGKRLAELPEGEYILVIKKNKPIRSLRQHKYYFFALQKIATDSDCGHSVDELHEICKVKFNSRLVVGHNSLAITYVVGLSTTGLDTAEFTGYMNQVKQWAFDEFNVIIPEPRDVDYAKWLEVESEYNDRFKGL